MEDGGSPGLLMIDFPGEELARVEIVELVIAASAEWGVIGRGLELGRRVVEKRVVRVCLGCGSGGFACGGLALMMGLEEVGVVVASRIESAWWLTVVQSFDGVGISLVIIFSWVIESP